MKNASIRNRTRVYIYPSYNHFDDDEVVKTTVRPTTAITTTTDDEVYVILPGRIEVNSTNSLDFRLGVHFRCPF